VAIRAILWRGLVEQNRLALDLALQGVAHGATHVCVAARQRELCAFVVVERGRGPPLIHVAIPALGDSILGSELAAVRIRMAGFAILRRSLELNFVRAGERFVAFAAGHPAMSPNQREFRFRMVEAADVDPGPSAVARFAAERGSIGALLRHALLEFAFMGIGVAGGARAVFEVKRQNLVRSSAEAGFVAFRAGNGDVGSGQHEARVLVFGNCECRAMEVLYGVAILATILIGSGGKLLVMRVLVAIRARRELHFVEGLLPGRRVAFVAGDSRVFSLERIVRGCVFLHAKMRWLPALDGVALRALALARARLELALVRIGRVAIYALGKGQRLFEIASGVAVAAADFQVSPEERVLCFRMVELHRRIHFFPTGRRVTGLACSLERALVRIGVAVDASAEFDSGELHCFVGAGREVALFAGYLGVHSGQGILCFRMVELLGLFPVGHVVAALAVGAELPFVNVLMARHAVLREP